MSVEKIASSLGSIIKIIVYGFVLLVIVGMFVGYNLSSDKKSKSKPVEIAKIDSSTVNQSTETVESKKGEVKNNGQSVLSSTEIANENNPAVALESKLKVEVIKITPEDYNEFAKAYSGIGLQIKVSNNSDKTIQGIKGDITILDAFGDVAGGFVFKRDDTMKPGSTKTHDLVYKTNLYNNKAQKLLEIKKWTSTFKAEKILVD